MASTTPHIQLETAASQQTQGTSVTVPKKAANLQGGLAASKWATAEDVAPKLSNTKGKKRNAPKAGDSGPGLAASKWATAEDVAPKLPETKGKKQNAPEANASASKPVSAQPKKQKKARRFIDGKWQNVPRTETTPAPAKQRDTNRTQQHWRAQPSPAANTPVSASVSEVTESISDPAVVSALLQRENFDWAEEMDDLEETQPIPSTFEPSVPLVVQDEDSYNQIEEVNAARERGRKANRRALLANLPTLHETGQDA